jgi:phosphoribosylamine--glycine ligase
MKVLVIGSGGREHAIVKKLADSSTKPELICTPGNPGIAKLSAIDATGAKSAAELASIAEEHDVDITLVGPEAPLVEGLVDEMENRGRRAFGPSREAAQLEGSKAFAKAFMQRNAIPTAGFDIAGTPAEARSLVKRFSLPVVVKASGLAAGKGVLICRTAQEADQAVSQLMEDRVFGEAADHVVVEEFLEGEEASFILVSDGENILPFAPTQDHKPVFDGDKGPNTGGMGAYCDKRILDEATTNDIVDRIARPTVAAMGREGRPFRGFLYIGLMMTPTGPKVLEYNVRLGDPEAQALLHSMQGDLLEVVEAALAGELNRVDISWPDEPSVCVVLASHGYPQSPRKGDVVHGVAKAESLQATVYHAGTKLVDGELLTSGGRVVGVTSSGANLKTAIENPYRAVGESNFEGMHFRKDIGAKGLKRW